MKKRNKKYNPMRTVGLESDQLLKNIALVLVSDDLTKDVLVEVVNTQGDLTTIGTTQAKALDQLKHKWFITLAVGCYSSRGVNEIKFDYIPCKIRYTHRELLDYLNERHIAFLEDLESKNVKMAWTGWVAKPAGRELTDSELNTIFDKLNAWG